MSKIIDYKICLIGDSSVGKTCVFKRLTKDEFFTKNISTIGMDCRKIAIDVDIENKENNKIENKSFNINLWDTAGQERFKAITKSYYQNSDGMILVYDLTNRESFEHVKKWTEDIASSLGPNNSNYITILIGNKLDICKVNPKERKVTEEEAKEICETYKLNWGGECSAKDNTKEDFINFFKKYTKLIYNVVGTKQNIKQNVQKIIEHKPNKKKKSRCFLFSGP